MFSSFLSQSTILMHGLKIKEYVTAVWKRGKS